jgi:predicted transcriptional regulator
MKAGKAPITWRALIQRINRKLAHDGERLVARRTGTDRRGGPEYSYLLIEGERVVEEDVDLPKLARTLGILRPWEQLP